jgi:hypothetical protein
MAVGGDEAVFRVGNLQEVHSNARQGDGLRGSRAVIGRRHPLQIEVIRDKKDGGTDENPEKEAHEKIVARCAARRKRIGRGVALGNNNPIFAPPDSRSVKVMRAVAFPSPV